MRTAAAARTGGARGHVPAPLLLVAAIVSMQCGAALATSLFDDLGVAGAVFARTAFAAAAMLLVARPRLAGRSRRDLALAGGFGLVLAAGSLAFAGATARAPLGLVVTIEFLGPLGVAAATSRRRRDLSAVALAAAGIALFAGAPPAGVDAAGLGLAALSALCWASYILLTGAVGRSWEGSSGLAVALSVSAAALAPWGVARGGSALLDPRLLAVALVVGLLVGAVPFGLEMAALRHLPARTYGILASLEPAVASAVGLVGLGQRPGPTEAAAAALVVGASLVATLGRP